MKPMTIHTTNKPPITHAAMCALAMLLVMAGLKGTAQETTVSIRASATVVEKKEIELVTIKDLEINESMAINDIIVVSARMDPLAGKMMIKGKAGEKIRINYQRELSLDNSSRTGTIHFYYDIVGFLADNPLAAEIFDATEKTVTLSSTGEYYIWIGGRLDISAATPGNYAGEFTIEIEYIE
jgi:hypothetical protein